MEERIVSAAIKFTRNEYGNDPIIILGVRHGCPFMNDHFDDLVASGIDLEDMLEEQGFVTSKYRFVTREDAWLIAEAQGQIIRDYEKCRGTLYSEHLY